MRSQVKVLQQIDCWDFMKRSSDENVIHTISAVKKKRNEKGVVRKYEASLNLCENEKVDYQVDTFSPAAQHFVI